jgi:hypothetical protein
MALEEEELMTSHALQRSATPGDIVLPETSGFQVELTASQISQMAAVTKTLIVETDGLNRDVEAFVTKPGRSIANQQNIAEFSALMVNNFQRAAVGRAGAGVRRHHGQAAAGTSHPHHRSAKTRLAAKVVR